MNKKLFTSSLILLTLICNIASAQITKGIELELSNSHTRIINNFDSFQDLHIGYYGRTNTCQHYYIYAFKYKRTWFLVANQDDKLNLIISNAPRQEKRRNVLVGEEFVLEALSKAYMNNYLKFKKGKKEEKEIDIRGFYKFKRPGKKGMKGVLVLEYPKSKEQKPLPWPLSIFQKEKEEVEEEVKAAPEQAKEAVEGNVTKEIEGQAQELKDEVIKEVPKPE